MNKALNYLGISARARKIAIGETADRLIKSKKAKIVFIANDCSDRTKERLMSLVLSSNTPYVDSFSSDEISGAIGQNNRMVIAISDEGLAKQILSSLK